MFTLNTTPIADPTAIVRAPGVRFTVLTSRLLRMEHDPVQHFEDRASQAFWHRRQPVPPFEVRRSEKQVQIETEHLRLSYAVSSRGLAPRAVSVLVKETGHTWRLGDRPGPGRNLLGTARTLDETSGHVRMEPGLMSRDGWALVDDSASLVFDESDWLQARPAGRQDLYLFGHGHDYRACLRDFHAVAGRPALIPRWVLGNWWSRYWAYGQDELQALAALPHLT